LKSKYDKNVFVNCPFDEDYLHLLHPLLFTIIFLKFNPRIALERADSGEPRFNKICELIDSSMYSIHDLSRIRATKKGEIFRLNMPFELGLDIGAKIFNSTKHHKKRCLILEKEKYRFQAAISDLSNSDIKHHKGIEINVVKCVRNWFAENGFKKLPSTTVIWYNFTDFMDDYFERRIKEGFSKKDIYDMPTIEMINYMCDWKKTKIS
jgi:hypothetical protein